MGPRNFALAVGLFLLGGAMPAPSYAVPVELAQESIEADGGEFWIRKVALDPAGTVGEWEHRLAGDDWLAAFDVFDAMQRSPESARWFCEHRKDDLRAGLVHPRSAMRASAWRIVRMGQGAGADCVDWSRAITREIGAEAKAWRNAALSEAWMEPGERGAQAYGLILQDLERGGAESHGQAIDAYRASAIHVGVSREETGTSLWVGNEGTNLRPLHAGLFKPMASSIAVEALRERCKDNFVEHGFLVEALDLAREVHSKPYTGLHGQRDWSRLESGLRTPPIQGTSDRGKLDAWARVLTELARLGSTHLAHQFWLIGQGVESQLSPESIRTLNGTLEAREFYIRLAVESGPVETLAKARGADREIQELVWVALEGDWRTISLRALEPWIRGEHGSDFQVLAVSRLCEAPASVERNGLLLEVVETCEGEALRLAFRALAQGPSPESVQERLHRIWRDAALESQGALLREMPNSSAWKAFAGDWLELVRELGPCDLLVLEHLSHLAEDSRWSALFERDLGEALEARFQVWRADKEPVSRDLARRAAALRRVQRAGDRGADTPLADNVLLQGLLRRVEWIQGLPEEHPVRIRFDFSKACVALISNDPGFVDWVRSNLTTIEDWPRRLRVEVALRLPVVSYSDPESQLHAFVVRMGERDYPGLGAVLKERWLSEPLRAGGLLAREATNRRSSPTLRQVAMSGLAARGDVPALLEIIDQDPGVTGPQIAMETLVPLADDRIDPALRTRWQRAESAALGDGPEREIEAHLEAELLLALVQRGALESGEASSILAGPLAASEAQWRARLDGVSDPEDWRPQRRVVQGVAQRGELKALLDRNPRWSSLDGRLLAKMAKDAFAVGDEDSAQALARWAEVALAGEPDLEDWRNAMGQVRMLRFRLARSRGDLANVAWYCDRFVETMLGGGISLESLVGTRDVREGLHPLARLSALRLQSLAMLAAGDGDRERAGKLLALAERYCGVSTRARDQQGRAARWIQRK